MTAPIHLTAEVQLGGDGLIRVTLLNHNHNLLARQLLRLDNANSDPIRFSTWLPFEIPTESTRGLLILETQDSYHRPLALRSVSLALQTDGEVTLRTQPSEAEWLKVASPEPLEVFSEGQFLVEGTAKPVTGKPIIFELVTDRGGVIGSSQLAVENPGETFTFKVPLSYAFITTLRDVRLVIRQTADPNGVNVILDSLPITLTP